MRAAVLLAAGASKRWGAGNKLFDRRDGAPLLARTLAVVRRADAQRLIIVIGWQHARVARLARACAPRARLVRARDHGEGMGASLRAAARALWPIEREVLLFLADMPAVDPRAPRGAGDLLRPAWRGQPGHPVLLRGAARRRLGAARGDQGPGRGGARLVPGGRGCVRDCDRPGRAR
ncbi:NTP transferase domain-containing protein [Sphingomonas morindae]|uniref:NTP transferase domain-containing protein n=1 Tax=Sphingomonas morindae TaxID=1541170 RepID=A0ABY4X7X0_9SPHN|nr:NTP transferase domain-containing protein [Sphingomonas morindae]USI73001.1 NTP transferase domain-containing protein [Sphingomonas morindae]